jgi:hypothetical protein
VKYLKKLKNELKYLAEKLSPPKQGDPPEYVNLRDVDRKGVLEVVIALIKIARTLDQSSETWGPKMSHEWCTFVANLESWCKLVPEPPSVSEKKNPTPTAVAAKKAPEPTNLTCRVSHTSQEGFEVTFLNLSQQELQSVRNALVIHSAYTQEAKEILAGMLDALRIAGVDTGDASYPVMPWEEAKKKKPEVEKPKAEA